MAKVNGKISIFAVGNWRHQRRRTGHHCRRDQAGEYHSGQGIKQTPAGLSTFPPPLLGRGEGGHRQEEERQ